MKIAQNESNLKIQSNLMLDTGIQQNKHRFLPGDFLKTVHPEKVDKRIIDEELTPRQKEEYLRYLPCSICGQLLCGCQSKY